MVGSKVGLMVSSAMKLQVSNSGALRLGAISPVEWQEPVRLFYTADTNITVWRVIFFGHLT